MTAPGKSPAVVAVDGSETATAAAVWAAGEAAQHAKPQRGAGQWAERNDPTTGH